DALAVEPDLARVGTQQPDDVLEHHALARAAGADDDQALSGVDGERQVVQHDQSAETLVDVFEVDQSHFNFAICDLRLNSFANRKSQIENNSAPQSLNPVDRQIPLLEQLGEEEVEDDDGQEAGDEAFGAGAADAGGAAGAGEALVATDQS